MEFLSEISSEEKILINLIKIITNKSEFFTYLNSILINQNAFSFLGSFIYTLNKSIRTDKLSLRENQCVYRKAFLNENEITEYYKIYKSSNKKFHWNSFVTCFLENSEYLNSNEYNFNAIFIIEFKENSFGINIENFSLTQIKSEILLPAMSVFTIRNIIIIKNNQNQDIVQIELIKIDEDYLIEETNKNLIENKYNNNFNNNNNEIKNKIQEKQKVKSSNVIQKQIDKNLNIKLLKIYNNELILLNFFQKKYSSIFTYIKDNNNKFLLKFLIMGPKNSPYENGMYHLNLEILDEYPNKPPRVRFMTYIWHPNIVFKDGLVYDKILNNNWKSSYSIIDVIEIIFEILIKPDKNIFLTGNKEAFTEYFNHNEKFIKNATEINKKYAMNYRSYLLSKSLRNDKDKNIIHNYNDNNYINNYNFTFNNKGIDFLNAVDKKMILSTDALVTRESGIKFNDRLSKTKERYNENFYDIDDNNYNKIKNNYKSDNDDLYTDKKSQTSKISFINSDDKFNSLKRRKFSSKNYSNENVNIIKDIITPLTPLKKIGDKKSSKQEIIKIDLRDKINSSCHSKSNKSLRSLEIENALNFMNLSEKSIIDKSDFAFELEEEGKIKYRNFKVKNSLNISGITPLNERVKYEKEIEADNNNYEIDFDSKKDIDISYI